MITEGIITMFYYFVHLIVLALPNSQGLPANVSNGITYFYDYAYQWNYIFPLNATVIIFGLFVAFESAILLFQSFKWLIHLVRGN